MTFLRVLICVGFVSCVGWAHTVEQASEGDTPIGIKPPTPVLLWIVNSHVRFAAGSISTPATPPMRPTPGIQVRRNTVHAITGRMLCACRILFL